MTCTSRRTVLVTLGREFAGRRFVVAWVAGDRRLLRVRAGRRVLIDFRGLQAPRFGKIVAVSIWGARRAGGPRPRMTRLYSICTARGIAYVNVGPRRGT